jgi:lipoprotein-anchoring transpeptidase ErfK/SrfK
MVRAGTVRAWFKDAVSSMRHAISAALAVAALLTLAATQSVSAGILVQVDKATQRMSVIVDGELRYTWAVSTGVHGTPSGTYSPQSLSRHHRSSLYNNAPMPYSIFYSGHYAIHGTNQISRLGRRASKGCVRLHPAHAAILFRLVQKHGMGATRIVVR